MKKRPPGTQQRTTRAGSKAGRPRTRAAATRSTPKPKQPASSTVAAVPVTAEELRVLQRELQRRLKKKTGKGVTRAGGGRPLRWNPDPEDLQKSVAQLVLTIVEFLRKLMERQAIRRMEADTLSPEEVEAVGAALMLLEETVRDIGSRFGLRPEDLNLDLGPVKLM